MSPRKSMVEARHTRQRILDRSLLIASVDGLDGLTIGRLATDLGISKAGLLGHFGTKQALQLAVIDLAAETFGHEVPGRARDARPGLPWLRVACEAWVHYLERFVPPGGCFFTVAAAEFGGRHGAVHDAITGMTTLWQRDLRIQVRRAVGDGDLAADTDADQLVFELVGIMLALNHVRQTQHDESAPDRARRALRRLLDARPHDAAKLS